MKIRKIIVALAAVLVPFLVFRVGSGLTEQQNVTLRDYTVSENEKTLTLHAAVFPPIEDIRDYKDEPKNWRTLSHVLQRIRQCKHDECGIHRCPAD